MRQKRVLLAFRNALYDAILPEHGREIDFNERKLEGIRAVQRFGDIFLVSAGNEVLALDSNLESASPTSLPSFESACAADDHLFLATEGKIMVYNASLAELASVPVMDGWKNAHDLVLQGERLYVLDNIAFPVYVLLYDLTSAADPQLLHSVQIMGLNQHLDAQFVDPGSRTWHVLQSYAHEGGGGQNLHTFSADTGHRIGSSFEVSAQRSLYEVASTPPSASLVGFARTPVSENSPIGGTIHLASGVVPLWALVTFSGPDIEPIACRLEVTNGKPELEPIARLSFADHIHTAKCRELSGTVCVATAGHSGLDEPAQAHLHLMDFDSIQRSFRSVPVPGSDDPGELVDLLVWEV